MTKPQPLTRAYLDARLEAQTAVLRRDVRELVQHFTKRFDDVDQRLDSIDVQLEAIKESMTVRREFENLVRELKAGGIRLDERRIFVV